MSRLWSPVDVVYINSSILHKVILKTCNVKYKKNRWNWLLDQVWIVFKYSRLLWKNWKGMDKMSHQFHRFKCCVKCNFDYNFRIVSHLVSAAFVAFVASLVFKDFMHVFENCLHPLYIIIDQSFKSVFQCIMNLAEK